jgi:hypothetical protein
MIRLFNTGERKKSRWSDEPPVQIPIMPPGVLMHNVHVVPGNNRPPSVNRMVQYKTRMEIKKIALKTI